jgi:DNA-binding transcriptional regulator YdaS (Cro superfamily)
MKINEDIKKLVDYGIKKTKIASVLGISKQLLNQRLKLNSDFSPEEKNRFYTQYSKLL